MERIDLRKLSDDELLIIRKQIVRLKVLGKSGADIFELSGVTAEAASRIWANYKRYGVAGITPKKRGRREGEQMRLNREQEKEIRQIIIDKTPDQLKLKFMLWTRHAICELIMRLYNIDLPLRTATDYLKRWGFTCQRPAKRSYHQNNVAVERFMKEDYPAIVKRARAAKAEIYWGDEVDEITDRNAFRLHLGRLSRGCVTIDIMQKDAQNIGSVVSSILNSTHITTVQDVRARQKYQPWSRLTRYGTMEVIGQDKIPIKRQGGQ